MVTTMPPEERERASSGNVCPMKFPPPGALYSHMRMHPERPKRGMKPPSEQPSPRHRLENESRGGCDDLLNSLVAKGRMSSRDDWKDIVDDEEAMGAVLGLLMLSQDTSFRGSCNLNKDRKIENSKRMKKGNYSEDKGKAKTVDESKCSDSDTDDNDEYVKVVGKCSKRKRHYLSNLSRDQKIEDPERMRIVKKGNGNYSDEKGNKLSDSDTDDDDYVIMEAKCLKRKRDCLRSRGLRIGQSYVDDRDRDTISPKDRNSIVPSPSTSWLEKYESSAAKKKRYECSTCNRHFSSKQGLGGHMASSGHKIKASAEAKMSLIGNEDHRRSDNDSSNNNVDSREDHDDTSFRGFCNLNKDRIENPQRTRIVKKGNYSDEKGKAKIVKSKWSDSDTDEDEYVKVNAKYLSSRGLRIGQSCVDDRDRGTITLQDRHGFIVPSPSTSPLKKYECSTCNKRFSSKQGLGGHMSSSNHKTKASVEAKRSLIGIEDRRRGDNDGSNNNVDPREDHDVTSLLTALSCNNQDRMEISDETIGEESNNTPKNVPRFDLNELPSMEDDEEHS